MSDAVTLFYTKKMFQWEHESAAMIAGMIRPADRVAPITQGIDEFQASAVVRACENSLSILTGLPGTGKTTSLRRAAQSFDKAGMKVVAAAPAAVAAQRMREAIHRHVEGEHRIQKEVECKTIHSLTKTNITGEGDEDHKISADVVFLDEVGLLGTRMLHRFLKCVDRKRTRIVLTGDHNQLASIDPGNVLRDMIGCSIIPHTHLTKIYRQGANSGIVKNAAQILKGEKLLSRDPETGDHFSDFYFIQKSTPEETQATILEYLTQKFPAHYPDYDVVRDIQVLSPGKKGPAGTKELNEKIRPHLNKNTPPSGCFFAKGDKVINRKNNTQLDIVNGELGYVHESSRGVVEVLFADPRSGSRKVMVDSSNLDHLHLAYAYTIHASQGAEFPVVIIPVHKTHMRIMSRNLLYTGLTRGKQLVFILGEMDAVERCLYQNETDRRYTNLRELIVRYHGLLQKKRASLFPH